MSKNKIKIAEEYNYDTNKVEDIYGHYDYCICIKDIKVGTAKWKPERDKKFAYKGEIFKYIVWARREHKYNMVILDEGESFNDRWINTFEEYEFSKHFMNLTEWRNKQLDDIGIE